MEFPFTHWHATKDMPNGFRMTLFSDQREVPHKYRWVKSRKPKLKKQEDCHDRT